MSANFYAILWSATVILAFCLGFAARAEVDAFCKAYRGERDSE